MATKKLKHAFVKLDIWETYVLVFWDCTAAEAVRYIKKNFRGIHEKTLEILGEYNEVKCQGVCIRQEGGGNSVIFIPGPVEEDHWLAILVHEATHAMSNVMEHWNIQKTKDTEEVLAGGIGHIVKHVLKAKRKSHGKKK